VLCTLQTLHATEQNRVNFSEEYFCLARYCHSSVTKSVNDKFNHRHALSSALNTAEIFGSRGLPDAWNVQQTFLNDVELHVFWWKI